MEASTQTSVGTPEKPRLHALAERVGRLEALDGPAEAAATNVRGKLPAGRVKDLLSGAWLGHALHPLLTDVPIGTWTSATLLDLFGGRRSRPAAQRLVGIGVLAAVPTSVSGTSDWADTTLADATVRRIGAVHAVANSAALALYGTSLVARRRGNHRRAVKLGLLGLSALTAGGHLGGHLSYVKGVGVNQTAFDELPDEWTPAVSEADVREGEATRASVGDVDIMLARHAGRIYALADRCTHRGGSLADGTIADGCVTCPLHDSIFRLSDGAVVQGPAGTPEPAFHVRVDDGTVHVRVAA
jgi:nitrite reductase/ring-hydroxylating ferredoxin subunit/uncharacterized membrane protein